MNNAAAEGADQALRQWVRAGRTLVEVGEEFASLRRERGLSPEDLARRAMLSPEAIWMLESGTRLPTREEFERLAIGLELTAGQLAEILRPVLAHQAHGTGAFQGCYQPNG
jgi:transcriptional regulator with XRE-family HTH domain